MKDRFSARLSIVAVLVLGIAVAGAFAALSNRSSVAGTTSTPCGIQKAMAVAKGQPTCPLAPVSQAAEHSTQPRALEAVFTGSQSAASCDSATRAAMADCPKSVDCPDTSDCPREDTVEKTVASASASQ